MIDRAGFGGGCHWCTEAMFQALRGVTRVEQGFARSVPPNAAWSEAVIVHFDPVEIGLEALIAVHLATHGATSAHSMRGKYRSAVYTVDAMQREMAREIIALLQEEHDAPLVTRVLELADFRASDRRFRDYYRRDPARPFCRTYIDPKLAKLRTRFADLVQE